jgi:hypothetical protein
MGLQPNDKTNHQSFLAITRTNGTLWMLVFAQLNCTNWRNLSYNFKETDYEYILNHCEAKYVFFVSDERSLHAKHSILEFKSKRYI